MSLAFFALLLSVAHAQPPARPADTGSAPLAVPAGRQAKNVAIITIRGEIKPGITPASFKRRLADAEASGADAVVVEIDTPGGEVGAVLEICDALKSSSIKNTVAWVHPNAYSGGAIIALACREIVASDPATLGDALPIISSFGMLNSLPEHERQKFVTPLVSEVVDSARRHGYDEYLVQGIVSRGVELWLVEDASTGQRFTIDRAEYGILFDGPAPDSRPRLVSAQGSRPRGLRNVYPEQPVSPGPSPDSPTGTPPSAPATEPSASPATGPAGASDRPDTSFRPASPALASMTEDVSRVQDLSSSRPFLTRADKGHYRVIEYVSDGQGPVVMKHGDLQQYGFIEATIQSDSELQAYFGASTMRRLDQSWSEDFAGVMTTRLVRYVLIAVFLVALFIELTHPGVALPGAIAVLALIGLVAPPLMIGMATWWEIAAILGGLAFIAIEIFVLPGFTVFGVVGLVSLFAGLVGTFVKQEPGHLFPDSPQGGQDLLYGVATVLLSCVSAVVAMYFIGKHFGSLPIINRMVLGDPDASDELILAMDTSTGVGISPGETGRTVTPLRPSGRAMIGDRMIDVVADVGFIESGVLVRVVEANAFRISVTRSDPGANGGKPA
jgi:membrane-bound serine protease (ClpP class)